MEIEGLKLLIRNQHPFDDGAEKHKRVSKMRTLKRRLSYRQYVYEYMTTPQEDDIDINPVTMLLLEDDGIPSVPAAAVQELQHQRDYFLRSIDSTVVIRQLPSQGLSFQLWPAANTLVALLDTHRCGPLSALLSSNQALRRLRILELGSGTGLVGIVASAILGANVTVTDLPHVLPNLRFNAEANSKVLGSQGGSVEVAQLGWGVSEDMEAIGRDYDLILGSDVVYHDHLYDPLLQTLRWFLQEGERKMVFVMAHLRRWKKESAFFKKAKKHFDVEVIHGDGPSNGYRVGVVVYRFAVKSDTVTGTSS